MNENTNYNYDLLNKENYKNSIKSSNSDTLKYNIQNEDTNDEVSVVIDEYYSRNRKGFSKIFAPISSGSLRASIINLSIMCIGTGCLSLPKRVMEMSIIVSIFNIIISGAVSLWTLKVILRAGKERKLNSYSTVILSYCGKNWALLSDIISFILVTGLITAYNIVIYQMIGAFVFQISSYYKNQYDNNLELFYIYSIWGDLRFRLAVSLGISILIILPLNLLKDVSKLRYVSIGGIISLTFILIVIVAQLDLYINNYKNLPEFKINIYNISTGFTKDLNFFRGSATLYYAFNCHYGLFPVYEKLHVNSYRRINKVITYSIFLDSFFYIIVGVSGYLTEPINTHDLIIKRYQIGDSDITMTICRLFLCFILLAKIPVNYNSLRYTLSILIWKDSNISLARNLMLTIPITLITSLIGVFFSEIDNIISFLGGLCSIMLAFFFPTFIYLKSNQNEYPICHWKNILIILGISVFIIIGLTSAVLSFIDLVKQFHT